MIIKKFLAKSEKAAIEMAKNELGNNAIVMNIKKVKPKGLAKLFVRGKVEVTAALDETPLYSQEEAAKEKRPVEAGKFSETEKKTDAPDNSSLEERISMLQALLEKQMMQKEGKTPIEAIIEAARMRLRPILMTSLAFILGVLPLVISDGAGSGAQNAVGTGVMGGMFAATVLAIYFVPVFFVVVEHLFARFKKA